ncbi:putative protein FAR1-RELATED SEQUENCE 10 [Eucalyptus grandis]|uniref:putative protein FAR1-RELATED SEQUENCE 10 n=1 Tax=Eucalyptus grandis TaxID=71139 RepID=UPI00192EF2EE|nr:putative protein FAR1-RELATED SEQUENCE 10 [Eucalyptus grandis]
MVSRFGLGSDKHIALPYSIRTSWALCYTRGHFLARMTTVASLRSVDSFLKGIFGPNACLRRFFDQVGISANFQNQSHLEMQYMPSKACIPMEEHARSILMPFAFNAFQNELVLTMQYAMSELADGSYLLRHYKKMDGDCLVMWIPEEEQIHCSWN